MAFLVVQDFDHHVLGDPVHPVAGLDDLVVVLDGAGLRLDDAADDVDDVCLLLRRLQIALLAARTESRRRLLFR